MSGRLVSPEALWSELEPGIAVSPAVTARRRIVEAHIEALTTGGIGLVKLFVTEQALLLCALQLALRYPNLARAILDSAELGDGRMAEAQAAIILQAHPLAAQR